MWGKRQAEKLGAKCRNCPLREAPLVLPPSPSRTKLLAVVGEGPGGQEVTMGTFLVGPSGDFFDRVLDEVKLDRSACHITNATLCFPKGYDDEAKAVAMTHCRPRLVRELKALRTRTIIAYGSESFKSLTGKPNLKSWCGCPTKAKEDLKNFTVIGAYHPAHVIRPDGSDLAPTVFSMTHRAVKLAQGKLPRWRWPKRIIYPGKQAVDALEEILANSDEVGYDVETRGTNPMNDLCMAVGLATRKVAVCVPWEQYESKTRSGKLNFRSPALSTYEHGARIKDLVRDILASTRITKVMHNQTHDILAAGRMGFEVCGPTYDTLPASNLVLPGTFHDLGFMMAVETHAPRWKSDFGASAEGEKGAEKFAKQDPKVLREYCCKDCFGALYLKDHLEWHIDGMAHGRELFQLYMDLEPITLRMTRAGFRRDRKQMKVHKGLLGRKLDYALEQIQTAAALVGVDDLNPNSTPQMHALFFGRLAIKPRHFSKKTGNPSLSEKALTGLLGHENNLIHHLAEATLRHRKNQALLKFVNTERLPPDDIIHYDHKQYGAKTFRWSTSSPDRGSLQNVPKPVIAKRKRGGGKYVKQAGLRDTFLPLRRGDWIVAADYDQIELKVIAALAGDEPLLAVFRAGGDPHAHNAADLFGIKISEVSKQERDMAKIMAYEICYGGSEETLWKHVVAEFPGFTLRNARRAHRAFLDKHPAIERYQKEGLELAEEVKMVVAPISGHEMLFFGPVEPSKVYNYPVQHTAADIINPAVLRLDKLLNWRKETLLAQVHDELITCGPNPIALAKKLDKAMTVTVVISGHELQFTVGVKMGPSWGEAEELKKGETLERGARRIAKKFKGRLKPLPTSTRCTRKGASAKRAKGGTQSGAA